MKKRIIILGSLVLLVVLGWTGAWFFIAGQLRQQIELQALADGETAPQLVCGELDIGGFPFRFDVECATASLVSGDLLVEIPYLRASAMAYRPTHLLGAASGPIAISDAFTGTRQEVNWTQSEASLRLENWRIARLSIIADGVTWTDQLFGDTLIAEADHVEAHLLDMPELHNAEAGRAAIVEYQHIAFAGQAFGDDVRVVRPDDAAERLQC